MSRSPAPPRTTDHRWSVHHLGLRPGVAMARGSRRMQALAAERRPDYAVDDPVSPTAPATSEPAPEVAAHVGTALADLCASLGSVAEHVRDLVGQVPGEGQVAAVAVELLDACFAEVKRVEGATVALKGRLISCASAAQAHRQAGVADTGAYLRERLGVSGREAKRQAELSKTLDAMNGAADAVADGRLGVEQAAILGRAARDGHLGGSDEVQRDLLETATASRPEDLARTVRKREQQADKDALRRDENRAFALRRASMSQQPGGMWSLRAELDPVNGELVSRALRAFMTPDAKDTPPGQRRSTDKRTADGLVDMADAALSGGSAGTKGGVRPHVSVLVMAEQPGNHPGCNQGHSRSHPGDHDGDQVGGHRGCVCSDHDGHPARGDRVGGDRVGGDRVGGDRVDGAAVRGGSCGDGRPSPPHGVGVTGSGTVLSPEATARLVCDSALSRIVMAGASQVLDVGLTTRNWTDPQRRAVVARDGHCRGPGCDRPPDWCDIHHIHWWRYGGPTNLANGILLCRAHHRLVHEGRWQLRLELDTGRAVFTDPRGKEVSTLPRGAPVLLG